MAPPATFEFDVARALKVSGWGFLAGGVPLFYWFKYLDKTFPTLVAAGQGPTKEGMVMLAKKLALNQLIAG